MILRFFSIICVAFALSDDVPKEVTTAATEYFKYNWTGPYIEHQIDRLGLDLDDAQLSDPFVHYNLWCSKLRDYVAGFEINPKSLSRFGYTFPVTVDGNFVGTIEVDTIEGHWTAIGGSHVATLRSMKSSDESLYYRRIDLNRSEYSWVYFRTCTFDEAILEDGAGDWYVLDDSGAIQSIDSVYADWIQWITIHIGYKEPDLTNRPPILDSPANQIVAVGDTLHFILEASDPNDDTLEYGYEMFGGFRHGEISAIPDARLDTGSGSFVYIAHPFDRPGRNFVFWVRDGRGGADTTTIHISVE